MSGIGYRQIVQFLEGEITLSEAVDRIKHETHRLVRRQHAWFRPGDGRIHWYHVDGAEGDCGPGLIAAILDNVTGLIEGFLRWEMVATGAGTASPEGGCAADTDGRVGPG
jgi:hypothetical protein